MKNDELSKDLVNTLIEIAEEEIELEVQKVNERIKKYRKMQLDTVKRMLPYMDLNSELVQLQLQQLGILKKPFAFTYRRK